MHFRPRDRRPWIPAAALLLPLALAGCYDGAAQDGADGGDDESSDSSAGGGGGSGGDPPPNGAPEAGPPECVDSRSYFADQVYRPVLQGKCYACHNSNGAAKSTDFILQGDDYPGYLEVNYNTLASISRLEIAGKPLVLRKPTLDGVEHAGGKRFEIDSPEYKALETMIGLFEAPIHCAVDKDIQAYFHGVVLLDELGTLRKATTLLVDRLPTAKEREMVEVYGEAGLDAVLDEIMKEAAFYTRIKSIYNDRLLTDAYLPGRRALDVVDPQRFPAAKNIFANDTQRANWANDAIAREPLNIIENVLRKGAPFTEIIRGDYTMVNPFSAQAYGLNPAELGFKDPADPNEFIEHNFEEIPEAGVLTTIAFLNRYPDTPTNRARARARFAFDFFLGQDVLQLAARPIDIDQVQPTNPTLFDSACNVCHNYIDPVAGAFRNYSYDGWYRPEQKWPGDGDMVPPGFGDLDMGAEDLKRALPWLADQIAADDGFALSVVYTMYQGLTGDEPLRQPLDSKDPDYRAKVRAFDAQQHTFKALAAGFVDSDYDLRSLIKGLVKTPWIRAIDTTTTPDDERRVELAPLGSARALTPELLDKKIAATVGFAWTRNGASALLADANYRFFYGGIDSLNVTTRLKQLSGVMSNIAERMASEVACRATAPDFSLPPAQRRLFPKVELSAEPMPEFGEAEIRANLQHLHDLVLGERLAADDPEITRSLQLFTLVLADGRAGLAEGTYLPVLPTACQGTKNPIDGAAIDGGIVEDPDYKVRAWMAVLTYLLGDYNFLYE